MECTPERFHVKVKGSNWLHRLLPQSLSHSHHPLPQQSGPSITTLKGSLFTLQQAERVTGEMKLKTLPLKLPRFYRFFYHEDKDNAAFLKKKDLASLTKNKLPEHSAYGSRSS